MSESTETWFQREILAHEAALVRFLSRKLSNPADVQDIRHDVYVRILEAAERELPARPKAFLFSVARHILIDRARRNRIVAIDLMEELDSLNVLIEEETPERRETGRQQLQRLSILIQRLPARCRDVVWMRRVEDLPQKVIARKLGIAEATVEKHLVRGIRMLADALYGTGQSRERIAHDQATHPSRAMETEPMGRAGRPRASSGHVDCAA
ncbi:MAG: sigma-70 family RNA polymerase sigma factor [Gammaproteobacteria bacterium]